MAIIQNMDICVDTLFPTIESMHSILNFTMTPIPNHTLELPLPSLPTVPIPPQVPTLPQNTRNFNQEKAMFAAEFANYQHVSVISIIIDAVKKKIDELGLSLPPEPELLPPIGTLGITLSDVLSITPETIMAALEPYLPTFPYPPFPPPPPWIPNFTTLVTPGSPLIEYPFAPDIIEFPIYPSAVDPHQDPMETFQLLCRNLITSLLDFIDSMITSIIDELMLGIAGLKAFITSLIAPFDYLPSYQDLLDIIGDYIRTIVSPYVIPPAPISVSDLVDTLKAAAKGLIPSPYDDYDAMMELMFSVPIPQFPYTLPMTPPTPLTPTVRDPEKEIFEMMKNMYSAMVASLQQMVMEYIDYILQIIPVTLPAICITVPIPDVTSTGLSNSIGATPGFPEDQAGAGVAFFKWEDFEADDILADETDITYDPQSDMGLTKIDENRALYFNKDSSMLLSARVIRVNPDTDAITFGTEITGFSTTATIPNYLPIAKLSDNKFVVAWQESSGARYPGRCAILTTSADPSLAVSKGLTATFHVDVIENNDAEPHSIIPLSDDGNIQRFAITYQLHDGDNVSPTTMPGLWIVVCRVSSTGTTISISDKYKIKENSPFSDEKIFGSYSKMRIDYDPVTFATASPPEIYDRVVVAYENMIQIIEIKIMDDDISEETPNIFDGSSTQVTGVDVNFTRHILLTYKKSGKEHMTIAAEAKNIFEIGDIIELGPSGRNEVDSVIITRPTERMMIYQNGSDINCRIIAFAKVPDYLGGVDIFDLSSSDTQVPVDLGAGTLGQGVAIQDTHKLLLVYKNDSSQLEAKVFIPNKTV